MLYDESTATLFAGDLFTHLGSFAATTTDDIVDRAIATEDVFHSSSLAPASGSTVRRLAEFEIATLALMHGPAFTGDCRAALLGLADDYDKRCAS